MSQPTAPGPSPTPVVDGNFEALVAAVQRRFTAVTTDPGGAPPLFVTDAPDLLDAFLAGLSPELRPLYVCSACRTFLRRYGAVVRVTATGETVSVLWDPETVAEPYVAAVRSLASAVTRAPIVDVFLATAPASRRCAA